MKGQTNDCRCGVSNFNGGRVTPGARWSKFNGQGANPDEMEQLQWSASKSEGEGGNSMVKEQIRWRWSKFNGQRANPGATEEIRWPRSKCGGGGENSMVGEHMRARERRIDNQDVDVR